jgi:hypothetical protein
MRRRSCHSRRCSMISVCRKSSREFRSRRPLPPPPYPSTSRRSLHHPLSPPVGKNALQDSSSINNILNNNSRNSPARRRITATTATAVAVVMAAMAVAPPTLLLPRVCGPPTSTPGPAPFKCGRVKGRGGGVDVQQPHLCPQAMLAGALPYGPPP